MSDSVPEARAGRPPCAAAGAAAAEPDITGWLRYLGSAAEGTAYAQAAERVAQALYAELRRAARSQLRREAREHTLGTTALVHEAWLRLAAQDRTVWKSRQHFLAMAAMLMRRILVDHALAARAAKRSADLLPLGTTVLELHAAPLDADVVAVHEALLALATQDCRAAQVVELRFFGGLEIEEVAQVLDLSPATVKRDWTLARAWLRRALGGKAEG